jgi:hypothetical protein
MQAQTMNAAIGTALQKRYFPLNPLTFASSQPYTQPQRFSSTSTPRLGPAAKPHFGKSESAQKRPEGAAKLKYDFGTKVKIVLLTILQILLPYEDRHFEKKIYKVKMKAYAKELAKVPNELIPDHVRWYYTGRTDGKTIQKDKRIDFSKFKYTSRSLIEHEYQNYPEKYRKAVLQFHDEAQKLDLAPVKENAYPNGLPGFPEIPEKP